jgi:hypothetical protein
MLRGTDDNGYGFERKHSNVYQPTAVELKITASTTKGQTTIYKTLHIKLKIEKHEPH